MNAKVLWTIGILVGMGVAPLWANDGVQLVMEKAVYKAGANGDVKFTVRNTGSVNLKVMSWAVLEGTTVVYSPASLGSVTLKPGQTKTLQWSKKDSYGKWVKAGSYQIKVGPILGATHSGLYHSVTVALTPSGKIAGNSRFPLEVGNEWKYRNTDELRVTKVTKRESSGWTFLQNPPAGTGWVFLTGSAKPVFYAWDGTKAVVLFRFGEKSGTQWTTTFPYLSKLRVGAAEESLDTYVGTFAGCYRIETVPSLQAFWFAAGIGPVQQRLQFITSPKPFKLASAKLKGSDGKWYTIANPS